MKNGKDDIRRKLLALRAGLREGERARLSALAAGRIRPLDRWVNARAVLLYAPIRNELDTWGLIEECFERGVCVLLPRCRPGAPGEMDLACASCAADLAPGAYGILEPDPDACPALAELDADSAPDVAVVPGVGFDRKGRRIGFGQGYYDRLLASPAMAGCLKVGLCYHFQLLDDLPHDPWDVPLQAVATDEELLWITS